jgi:hypothetical protein
MKLQQLLLGRGPAISTILLLSIQSTAQPELPVDSNLLANSTVMQVRIKGAIGWNVMFEYEFGPYKTIKSKTSSSSKNGGKLFSKFRHTESRSSTNRILVINGSDSVKISTRSEVFVKDSISKTRGLSFGSDKNLETYTDIERFEIERVNSYTGLIQPTGDTSGWFLMDSMTSVRGAATRIHWKLVRGEVEILISPLTGAKGPDMPGKPARGFQLSLDGRIIGAVQTRGYQHDKQYVWILNTIDKSIQNIVAAVAVCYL